MHLDQTSYRPRSNVDRILITSYFCIQYMHYSPYELTFGRKPKLLLNIETNPDVKISRNFEEYYDLLNKRIKCLQNILFNFKSRRLAMINKNRENFQYKGGDLVYIISPLTSQLRTNSSKISMKIYRPCGNL